MHDLTTVADTDIACERQERVAVFGVGVLEPAVSPGVLPAEPGDLEVAVARVDEATLGVEVHDADGCGGAEAAEPLLRGTGRRFGSTRSVMSRTFTTSPSMAGSWCIGVITASIQRQVPSRCW